jgi:GntR family transcriptional regulator
MKIGQQIGKEPTYMAAGQQVFQFRLDLKSGVPVYRQLIDQVLVAVASGGLTAGDQLPTVRQLAVDLSINPNTVVRAYKELEIRGMLTTQQGTGTFITSKRIKQDELQRQRRLTQMVDEFVARVSAEGYKVEEIIARLEELRSESGQRRQ